MQRDIQIIIVDSKDKEGVGMLHYFKNMLAGNNVQKMQITTPCGLLFDDVKGKYIFYIYGPQIGNVKDQYRHFKNNWANMKDHSYCR